MPCAHITFSSTNRMPIFGDESARRLGIHRLVQVAGPWLVAFCFVDDHAHVVAASAARSLTSVARALKLALAPLSSAPLAAPHLKPIEDRAHLRSVVRYTLRQVDHHGLDAHPATWSGSWFQDIVGARWLPGFGPILHDHLPRFTLGDALDVVGLDRAPGPAGDAEVRRLGGARIVSAAAAVHAAPPALEGHFRPVVLARRTAARLAHECGVAPAEIAWALRVTPRAVRRLRGAASMPVMRQATRIRLSLEEQVTHTRARRTERGRWRST